MHVGVSLPLLAGGRRCARGRARAIDSDFGGGRSMEGTGRVGGTETF